MPPSKGFQITGAAAAAQDPQHRHQQQEPLWVAHPTAVAAIGDGLEKADQVISSGLIDCSGAGFGQWKGGIPLTKPNADRPRKSRMDRPLGSPGVAQQSQQAVADQVRGRLMAGRQEQIGIRDQLRLAEPIAVNLGLDQQAQ